LKNPSTFGLMMTFSYLTLFNLLDLSTTIEALKGGFAESNVLLLSLSSFLSTNIIDSLILVKVLLLALAGLGLLIGVLSKTKQVRNRVFETLLVLAVVFCLVSVNNFYQVFAILH
jgi:hypothetical protein